MGRFAGLVPVMPSLAEVDDTTLYVGMGAAVAMILYCVWDYATTSGITTRMIVAAFTWAVAAVAGPAKLGWPADSSFVAGGAAFAVVAVGGRLLGWR